MPRAPSCVALPEALRVKAPLRRAALVLVGAAAILVAAWAVFDAIPASAGPGPGTEATVTESVERWTPQDGFERTERTSTHRIEAEDGATVFRERISSEASPRGDAFELEVEDGLRLAHEPGARAGFPATPFMGTPPETVYVAVPWEDDEVARVGAYDRFERAGTVERGGIELVEYTARHGRQAFLHGDTIWYRQSSQTALVEPVTGTVVDYRDHESLWRESFEDGGPLLGSLQQDLAQPEKAWEATVEPTEASSDELLEQAKAERAEVARKMAGTALAGLVVGDACLLAALMARPRRLFGG